MAVVKGVKEQVHLPLYDCIEVKPEKQLGDTLTSNVLKFFIDVTGKTKLLTNMQAASLLPHWNTFECRALRVVISDLAPKFAKFNADVKIVLPNVRVDEGINGTTVIARVNLGNFTLNFLLDLARRLADSTTGVVELTLAELAAQGVTTEPELDEGTVVITKSDLIAAETLFKQNGNGKLIPASAQIFPKNGSGTVIGNFIYNTVTTFFVGEKIMIQVPTWFFPAGAGPYSEDGGTITHGYPNPQATFRFAEPVLIETQQNFRVEIEIPESDVLKEFQRLYGPLFVWVVLDGYMTRDVQ
jgi:hypothetical protein